MVKIIRIAVNGRALSEEASPRLVGGILLVPARAVAEALKARVTWEGPAKKAIIQRGELEITFTAGEVQARVGGENRSLPAPPELFQGHLFVPACALAEWLGAQYHWEAEEGIALLQQPEKSLKGKKVVLDPGHGGKDGGAVGYQGLKEKEVNLALATRLLTLLQAGGAQVTMTRTDDTYLTLTQRVAVANQSEAEFFLSLHNNYYVRPEARGTETYYYYSWQGQRAARLLHAELVAEIALPDRGVREANFYVLRHTQAPAVLAEVGFVSNPQDAVFLQDAWFQERAALALYRGIRSVFEKTT